MATGCKLTPCLKKNCATSDTQCLTFTYSCIHVCLLNPRLKANIHGSCNSSDKQIGLPRATTRDKFEIHEGSLGSKFKVRHAMLNINRRSVQIDVISEEISNS